MLDLNPKPYRMIIRNHLTRQPKSVVCSKCKAKIDYKKNIDASGNIYIEADPHVCSTTWHS